MAVTLQLLQELAELRKTEASCLLQGSFYSGAYYLTGYAIECAMKACIAKTVQAEVIQDRGFESQFYVHDLEKLLHLSGLGPEFEQAQKQNRKLRGNWGIVSKWNEASRYETWTKTDAEDMFLAATEKDGVFPWFKTRW